MRRENRFDVDDGKSREAKHSLGGRQSFSIPPGLSMWRPKKSGSHSIDVIAYHVTDAINRFPDNLRYSKPGKWYGERTFWVHALIGVNDETYTCSARTFGKPCLVCEARAKLLERPDGESQKEAKEIKPKERQLFLILDHDEPEKGIQLWETATWNFGRHLDSFIGGARKQNRDAYRQYFHPINGFSMRIVGTENAIGDGKNTEYTINEFFKREKDLPDELFDHGYDLDAMIREVDYETLKLVYLGTSEAAEDDDDGDDGDEAETTPPPRNRLPLEGGRNGSTTTAPTTPVPAPKPKEEPTRKDWVPGPRDRVSFEWRGEPCEGEVVTADVSTKMARIKVDGRDKPVPVEWEDLTLLEQDTTFDLKSPPPQDAPKKGKDAWSDDEGDNDPVPPTKGKRT